jgi:hypothetical protein
MSVTSFDEIFNQTTDFEKLTKQLKGNKKDYKDDRFWMPTKDKTGEANAVIRFLPTAKGDELPFVKTFSHFIKGPTGKVLSEKCPNTIGKPCPICEENSRLWSTGKEDIARSRKRDLKYISNILIIEDKENPENEGKVFLFKYGSQIMEKITDAQQPEYEDDPMIDAFSFKNGANFRLKVTKKDKYDTYEKSTFAKQSVLFGGDVEKIKAVWEKQTSLAEFVKPEDIKSYNELQEAFSRVIAERPTNTAQSIEQEIEHRSLGVSDVPVSVYESSENLESFDLDDMDDMESFKSLIE